MATKTTKTVYKIDVVGTAGRQTVSVPDPKKQFDGDDLATWKSDFNDVGLTILDGYMVVTDTYNKMYPSA